MLSAGSRYVKFDNLVIFDEIASGSLGALQELHLDHNQIGDAGMTHVSRAIASGALGALVTLGLAKGIASATLG